MFSPLWRRNNVLHPLCQCGLSLQSARNHNSHLEGYLGSFCLQEWGCAPCTETCRDEVEKKNEYWPKISGWYDHNWDSHTKQKLTFSFNIVIMLNVYLIVLKANIFGSFLKQARFSARTFFSHWELRKNLSFNQVCREKIIWSITMCTCCHLPVYLWQSLLRGIGISYAFQWLDSVWSKSPQQF